MKTVRDVMTTNVIRVSPTNRIKTAIILVKGHNIGGLPVMDGDRILGVLDYRDILGKDNDIPVQNVMDKEFVSIPADMPITDAADLMAKINADRLFVMESGQLIGVITRGDLLPELGKSFDPITSLPRADAMRDWGISALKSGREVTVIFLDLDNFGMFNKKYGHIIGDKVLQHVAEVLQKNVEEDRDMLCRYAGDEFAIVTTRNAEEAQEFADFLAMELQNTPNSELPEPVTGAFGVYGGKRTKEREDVHYNATLDNLINLASKACTVAKENRLAADGAAEMQQDMPFAPQVEDIIEQIEEQAAFEEMVAEELIEAIDAIEQVLAEEQPVAEMQANPGELASLLGRVNDVSAAQSRIPPVEISPREHKRLRIQLINFSWNDTSMATAEVELTNGDQATRQSRSGFALGSNALRLMADATAQAVCDFMPKPGFGVVAEHVHLIHAGPNEDVIVLTALLMTPQAQVRVSGSSIVKHDVYRAVSAAFLNAINRQISTFL